MLDTVYIYTLSDPTTKEIRYVGKTINLQTRLAKHKRDAFAGGSTSAHRNAWLRGLLLTGVDPKLEVIEETTLEEWQNREQFYIAKYRSEGCNLTNMSEGGEGCTMRGADHWNYGNNLSPDTKTKISVKAKQRWQEGVYEFHKLPLDQKRTAESAAAHRTRFKEYNDTKIVSESTKEKISKVQSRPIVLVDDKGIIVYTFDNARIAAEFLGCKRSNVNNRRRLGGKLLDKYSVHYEDQYNPHPPNS